MAVKDTLGPDQPTAHLRGWFLRPRARNSSSAWATTAEIVRPETRACSRTAAASRAGTLTVNTTVASGTGTRPDAAAWSTYRRACRGEQPNRPASTRAASAAGAAAQQVSSELTRSACSSTHPTMNRHAITILPDMSPPGRDTPRPFQPPVAQRDIKAEVIYCVGGVLSPLLLNIALHGLEEAAGVRYRTGVHAGDVRDGCPALTRYADNLVVCCHSRQQAEQVKARLAGWLEPRGLAFNEAKTRIVPLSEGFDFLGFNLRRYPNGKLLIKPGVMAIKRFRNRLAKEFRALRGANVAAVLAKIVPITRGWVAYYRTVVSSRVFRALDNYLWKLTYKWACWSHSSKPKGWITGRYFRKFSKFRNDRWVFGDKDTGAYLPRLAWTDIVRHTLVKGGASADDPALAGYWAQRRQKVTSPLDSYTVRLLSRQDGRCSLCGENLLTRDQPPQSPEGWERWFLRVTRKAIEADYLVHHDTPSAARSHRTHLVHDTCHRSKHQPQISGR